MYAASTQTYNTPDYDHEVGSIISSDQYIHDFSCLTSTAVLEIHLTVKVIGRSRIRTLRLTVYIQISFQSISERWPGQSSSLRTTSKFHLTRGHSRVYRQTCAYEKDVFKLCFSHAYTYCTWHIIVITQVYYIE